MLEVVRCEGTRAQLVEVKVLRGLCSTIMTELTEVRGIVDLKCDAFPWDRHLQKPKASQRVSKRDGLSPSLA